MGGTEPGRGGGRAGSASPLRSLLAGAAVLALVAIAGPASIGWAEEEGGPAGRGTSPGESRPLAPAPAGGAGARPEPPAAADLYVFRLAGCAACHTATGGAPLAGGRELHTPFGIFRSPNITSHPEHGIGRWSEADLVRALTWGESPGGAHYYPVFPFPSYTRMQRADMAAVYRVLQASRPVARPSLPHTLGIPYRWRALNRVWKLLFHEPGAFVPDPERSRAWNRGAYIVIALAHCGECHTPRNALGALDRSRWLAGNPEGPDGAEVPDITPDPETGIGEWSRTDLVYYLRTGIDPDGDVAGDAMAEVIENGLQYLTDEDAAAVAEYLFSLPPSGGGGG